MRPLLLYGASLEILPSVFALEQRAQSSVRRPLTPQDHPNVTANVL